MASAGLNEESVEKKLMSVTNTQDSIQSLSLWIIYHKSHYAHIVELWYKVMKKSVKPSHRLTLFYLCNDVVQTCKKKKALVFINGFRPLLRQATALVRDAAIRPKVERIFSIWEERQVYDKDLVTDLRAILDGKQVDGAVFKKPFTPTPKEKLKKEKARHKDGGKKTEKAVTSSASTKADKTEAGVSLSDDKEKKSEKDLDTPSEEALAAFKPMDLIEKMQSYKKQASKVDTTLQKLSHLKLDASSIEAVKRLKDRAHGNEFSNDFEESCLRLEETAEELEKLHQEQKDLMTQLHIAEFFYDQQNSEARIVTNAYKNYGARIGNMKKKVDEMLRMLPSPTVSPPALDMSPGSTSPGEEYEPTPISVDFDSTANGGSLAGSYDGDETMSPVGSSDDNSSQVSGFGQIQNRISSFIPSLQSGTSSSLTDEEHPIPVYVPQPIANGSISGRRPSANKTLTESDNLYPSEEGGSTPLTDEASTTPVMDEEPEEPECSPSPPPPPPPPPPERRKENPIDFLSRLIAQTQKTKSQSDMGTNSSFLANFTQLTGQVKKHIAQNTSRVEEEENSASTGSPRPKCWAEWKAEKAVERASAVEEQPNMSLPPPPLPPPPLTMFSLPASRSLGVPPPPPLPVPSMPAPVPPPSSMDPVGLLPTSPIVVSSVPPLSLTPLTIPPMPTMSVASHPSPVSSSTLPPLGVPPPPPIPQLSSPPSLAPRGMPPASPVSPLSSPSSQVIQCVPTVTSLPVPPPPVPPPVSPSSISPLAIPVAAPMPVPAPGLPASASPFYQHTSPGQKENWPEVGEGMESGEDMMPSSPSMDYPMGQADMPYPPVNLRHMAPVKGILRNNNSVLRELTPSMEELSSLELPPLSSPTPPPVSDDKQSEMEGSAIATLASGPSRGGQGFMDKLKSEVSVVHIPNPNLMTLTQGGDEDLDDDEDEEEEEEDKATRIPVLSSVVRRVDPQEKKRTRDKNRHFFRGRDLDKHSSSKYQRFQPQSSSQPSNRDGPYGRERHYNRENAHGFSDYEYRDDRSFGYESVQPSRDYPLYSENVSEVQYYDSYGQPQTNRPFHKYGVSQGSNHRSYRY